MTALTRWATRYRHHRVTSPRTRPPARQAARFPTGAVLASVWPCARASWPGPLGWPSLRWPWNSLRWAWANLWPARSDGARHRWAHRAARAAWATGGLVALVAAAGLAAVATIAAVLVWAVGQAVAAGLILAGWSPPLNIDEALFDPDQGLVDIVDREPPGTARTAVPDGEPPPPDPEPPTLEERQVAAAEAHARAMQQMAVAETARPPAATPVLYTSHHPAPGPARDRIRFGIIVKVLVLTAICFVGFFACLITVSHDRLEQRAPATPAAGPEPGAGP